MAAYVLATVFCFQRGSAESKDPDEPREEVDEDPRQHQHEPQAPGPVRKGGLALTLYAHSLSTAFAVLFVVSFLGHAASGTRQYNAEQRATAKPPCPCASTWAPRAFGLSHSRIGRANF